MNEFGQIAVLVDSNNDYFYYYQLDEERVVRITEDGVARINAYWDIDILTEDMLYLADDRDFTIEYLDDGVLTYFLEEAEETEQTSKMISKLNEYLRRTAKCHYQSS